MFRKATTHEDFNRYVAKKTGSHPRIVDAALADESHSEEYFKQTRRKVRAKNASDVVALACFACSLYNIMTVDFGYSIHERDMQISTPHVTAASATFDNASRLHPAYRQQELILNSNLPVKGGLFFAFLTMGMAMAVYGKNVRRSLQEDREDLRSLAMMPKPENK